MKISNRNILQLNIILALTSIFLITNVENVFFIDAQTNHTELDNKDVKVPTNGKMVNYYQNISGYLVNPNNASTTDTNNSKLPAIIMIHEWWGLNQQIKNEADKLANEGFVVLAIDLFNGKVASTPSEAMKITKTANENQTEMISNMKSAVNYLKNLDNVDSTKIASIGWCFGGGQSLQLALNSGNDPLAATIIYYGNLVDDKNNISKIKWPVLGFFGGLDNSIPINQVNQFRDSLNSNNVTNEIYIYENVGHAFANPTGDNYAPNETKDAWNKTIEFLTKYLK